MNQPKNFVSDSSDGLAWLTRPYRFLRQRAAQEGDSFSINLGRHGHYVLFSKPSDIREIFAADAEHLHAGQGNAVLKAFLGAGSLLLLEEAAHHRERRVLSPGFHPKRLATCAHSMLEIAHARIDCIEEATIIRVQDVMQEITLGVIIGLIFGDLARETENELTYRLTSFLNDTKFNLALIGELDEGHALSPTWVRFKESFAAIRGLLGTEVERRRASNEVGDDVFTMMLTARYADGEAMSDDAVVDELLTMVVTGYETTATALAWALYWTHRDDRVRTTLRERVREVDPAAAMQDPYVVALCKEVLRIRPVIPIVARRVQAPIEIGGRSFAPGTVLAPCIFLTHHRADLYADPDVFRPERFLERSYAASEYLPFGGGNRKCVGMGLAMMEMATVLTLFVQRLDLELVDGEALVPQRRSVTISPSQGTPMRVIRRRPRAG